MNKVQKIREEVEKLKSQLLRGACSSQIAMETHCKEEAYNEVLAILDTMQEEPVSKEFEKTFISFVNATHNNNGSYFLHDFAQRLYNIAKEELKEPVSEDLEEAADVYSKVFSDIAEPNIRKDAFIAGANWQKQQDLIPSTELGNFIDKLSKQFPEVSFAKLSRIAVRVAKWQKEQEYTCYEEAFEDGAKWKAEQFEQERLKHCDELTEAQAEIESDFVTQHLKENNRTPTFIDAIEYGMQTMKEQMMKGAIDAKIGSFTNGTIYDADFNIDSNLKDGDKVKVIVINKDFMKIVRFDEKGNCQFVYFNWRKFKLETSCWANSISGLFGRNNDKKHVIIGLHNW